MLPGSYLIMVPIQKNTPQKTPVSDTGVHLSAEPASTGQNYFSKNGSLPNGKLVIQPELDKFGKAFVILSALLLFDLAGVFAQHLKSGKGHENNPYYSNTDMKKLIVSNEDWKRILDPDLYAAAREHVTARSFTGQYWNRKAKGTYYCAVCGNELFRSDAKFSSTGPDFFDPLHKNNVSYKEDNSHGMKQTEVRCARCNSHLGHILSNGPAPAYKRFYMNPISLDFQPDRLSNK